jgi:nucleoside-diphosphate-sugar epimerase
MLRALEALEAGPLPGPLNIGPDERISISELAREVVAVSGKPIDIEFDPSRETSIWGQVLDCRRAREVLGWRPTVGLREGLRATYEHLERELAEESAAVAARERSP